MSNTTFLTNNFSEVAFTGFTEAEKVEFARMAMGACLRIRAAVTKKLNFLVTGPTAGWKKLEVAKGMGVQLLTAEQFKALCETGEVPARS